MNIIKHLLTFLKNVIMGVAFDRIYTIGTVSITLPKGHLLDAYQKKYKKYDTKLSDISKIIFDKYNGDFSAIDIGANVGDTAALMRKVRKFPIICVEGSPYYLKYLYSNALKIGDGIKVYPCFIGDANGSIPSEYIAYADGTARILDGHSNDSTTCGIPIFTLEHIWKENLDLPKIRFIKIDTDGFDFRIICSSIKLFSSEKPIVFFEYAPYLDDRLYAEGKNAISLLVESGYRYFIIYDNFGNFMCSVTNEYIKKFKEINSFLHSVKLNRGGVIYVDICAFTESERDVFEEIYLSEYCTK